MIIAKNEVLRHACIGALIFYAFGWSKPPVSRVLRKLFY